jgi:hypothetical protein
LFVCLSGNTLVATAWFEDSSAKGVNGDQNNNGTTDSGAAYVYVRDGDTWKPQAYLKASDSAPYDYFGAAAVLEGDTLVVSAIHEGLFELSATMTRPGAAYVFTRSAGVWSQTQRIEAPQLNGADMFGLAVDLEGDTLVVGAPLEATSGQRSGAAYIFERVGGVWMERQMLKSSAPKAGALFGSSLALEGDHLVVGAPNEAQPDTDSGSAEVFVRRGGMWVPQQRLGPPTPIGGANFGFAVALHGNRIVVGAPRTASLISTVETPPGEVYVFDTDGEHWNQSAVLRATAPDGSDFFGLAVGLTDTVLAVGAPGDASGARGVSADPKRTDAQYSGAMYLFAETADGWAPSAYIKPHNTDANDGFGWPFAIDGNTLAVGAILESSDEQGFGGMGANNRSQASGAVYVFQ